MINSSFLFVFILWLVYLWKQWKFYKFAFRLPGPIGLPFIGIGLRLLNGERLMKFIVYCKKKYDSPMVTWLGPHCLLVVSDPDSVKTILTSDSCINKSSVYKLLEYVMGKGAFTSNVPLWNKRHKLLKPAFHNKILSSYLNTFNKKCDILCINIQSLIGTNGSDIFEYFKKYTLEVACQTTIGKNIDLQNNEFNDIVTAYSKTAEAISERMYKPWLYIDSIYELSSNYKTDSKYSAIVDKFMDDLINDKKSEFENKIDNHSNMQLNVDENDDSFVKTKDIFIDHIAKFVESGQITWKDVKDESNVVIAAAFETTFITLYLCFLCISMHPEQQEKLGQALIEMFPDPDFEISDQDLLNMPFMEMIINESMRCIAPVPVVGRVAMNDFDMSNGIVVPKGTEIIIDIYNLHRDPKYWGPEAHKFNPDNFLPDNVKQRPVYAFVPFTKGLRMCLGYKYAMNLLKIVLAKVFRKYKVSTTSQFEDLILKANISIKLKEYPTFKIEKR